jgi:hypothetical protein
MQIICVRANPILFLDISSPMQQGYVIVINLSRAFENIHIFLFFSVIRNKFMEYPIRESNRYWSCLIKGLS